MASTQITITHNGGGGGACLALYWLNFEVIGAWTNIDPGETKVIPCEWVWYNIAKKGGGWVPVLQWVYGGSHVYLQGPFPAGSGM